MNGILVGALLIASLFIAEHYTRSHPLHDQHPLDVDSSLPFPWAGHASSVCSLTALFGAYLVILLLVGPAAIVGAAVGSIVALVALRNAIRRRGDKSFEQFLASSRFSHDRATNEFSWSLLVATQAVFAASELLLLREIVLRGLHLSSRGATTFAVGVALVGYLYCLRGGYHGVFRTDVLQFFFVAVMCVVFSGYALLHVRTLPGAASGAGYWAPPPFDGPVVSAACRAMLGAAMGAAFLAASPDTWKRVFVTTVTTQHRRGFSLLVLAGAVPFLLLTPIVYCLPADAIAADVWTFVDSLTPSRPLMLAFLLGLTASFLSSFDSALVSGVQVLLVRAPGANGLAGYRLRLGVLFLAVVALVVALIEGLGNPYAVAAALVGPYAILGGLVLGTRCLEQPVRRLFWIIAGALVSWVLIVATIPDVLRTPTIEQLALIPPGAGGFLLFLVLARASRRTS